ncbi:MAG: hydantoin racemase, partial [Thaumarchaeota archaeon]
MKRFRVGVIRVITLEDRGLIERHGRIMEKAYPDIETLSICIEDQPKGIFDESSEKIAAPKIVEAGRRLLEEGVDAIFVSCAADPAVEDLRRI